MELIGQQKPSQEQFSEQELVAFLATQISAMKIDLPERIKKAQRSAKYTIVQISKMRAQAVREVCILEAILKLIVEPPPKESSCMWKKDKRGGFGVMAYISPEDLAQIKLPTDDANLFQELIAQNKAVGVLSALSMIFGHWEKQRQQQQKEIVDAVREQVGHA